MKSDGLTMGDSLAAPSAVPQSTYEGYQLVLAELAELRKSLEESVALYDGYRESAAIRAARITELVSQLEELNATVGALRDRQRSLESARSIYTLYQRLQRRRGGRLVLRLVGTLRRLRRSVRSSKQGRILK